MGVIHRVGQFFKNKLFNRSYYKLVQLVLLSSLKKRKSGRMRWKGSVIEYNDISALAGMFHEIIYQQHYKFYAKSDKPVIIDCGANIGLSLLYFYKTIPNARIIGIEADPDVFKLLEENCHRNKIHAELINKAVWTTDNETIQFGRAGADVGSLKSTENSVEVKTLRLKKMLEEVGRTELLKIDIEGSEVDVLNDCQDVLSNVENIFVEYHSFPNEVQQLDVLLAVLTKNKFRYHILQARKMSQPFVNRNPDWKMDLQLNIFAFR